MTLDPARAAVRLAVRPHLADRARVLVACSGGADSLALLAAAVFEARRDGVPVVGATVDHGLQAGSAEHTAAVVAQMAALGVAETATVRVRVDPGPGGIEAGAREARYAALGQLAQHLDADAVLLGHTRDDQAETVLLGLTRGSGGRSLQGMRPAFDQDDVRFARPLLGLTRTQTEAACRADGIDWWEDPHNADPRFTRARIRHAVMPLLEAELGPGVAAALARTAEQLRADTTALENWAEAEFAARRREGGTDLSGLDRLEPAVATRVVRRAVLAAGAIGEELTREHVLAVLALTERSGRQGGRQIQLPGHLTAFLDGALLRFRRTE